MGRDRTSGTYATEPCTYDGAMHFSRFDQVDWLRYAGLFTFACVGTPLLHESGQLLNQEARSALSAGHSWAEALNPDLLTALSGWWLAYLGFGLAYWFVTAGLAANRPGWTRLPLLIAMNLAAIAISWFSQSGLSAMLLLVIAGVLPWLLPTRVGLAWMIGSNLSLVPIFLGFEDAQGEQLYGWFDAFLQSFLYLGFCSFTFVTSFIAKGQAQEREEQRRLNAELRATRALLAESSRVAERVRIARELHDLIGHHLTVLTLNLEVASHLVSGTAQDKVRQAQSVARLLLSDVREAVSRMRHDADIDLGLALRALIEGLPTPTVHLDLPEPFEIDDPRTAHVLLRAAQETLTNTVRHAHAGNLWWQFRLDADSGQVVFESRDDGVGVPDFALGNGLRGMQERIQDVGGSVQFDVAPGRGFALRVSLPKEVNP